MTARLIGETGSRKRRRFLFVPVLLVACTALLLVAGAQAVHDETFQLDGDVIASTTTTIPPGPTPPAETQLVDWNSLINADGSTKASLPTGFETARFDKDFVNTGTAFVTSDTTTYATGSKDTLPISGWQCNFDNNVNSKIDVDNAYAAIYTAPSGDEILYFALERNANTGTADVGFWFLQSEVGCESTGGAVSFSGVHTDGDLLIVSEFTGGGTVSTINVYRWNGGATGTLGQVPVASGVDCRGTTVSVNDLSCGAANKAPITTPWLTAAKTLNPNVGNTLPIAQFYEAGLNLTDANLGGKCFSTFIGDTRSSTSLTATLFDYSLGVLGKCGSSILTTPQAGDGSSVPSTIGAAARVAVRDHAVITVEGTDGPFAGTVKFFLCGPLALDSTTNCATGGVQIGAVAGEAVTGNSNTATVNSATATLTSAGDYCWRAEYSGDTDSGVPGSKDPEATDTTNRSECFQIDPLQPTLTTQASGTVQLGSAISDTAELLGTAKRPGTDGVGPNGTINATVGSQLAANGQITWRAFGPNNCTTLALADTSRTVSGNGVYPKTAAPDSQAAVSFTPGAVGEYTFRALYTGSSPNTKNVAESPCPDTTNTEKVNVVNANVSVSPPEATNEVNTEHTFTITTEAFPASATPVSLTSITPTLSPAHAVTSTCNAPTTPAGEPNKRTCTVKLTSTSAGTFTLNVTSVWSIGGVTVTRDTDPATLTIAGPGGSGPAVKHFVDANISITPAEATNEVGTEHTFVITSVASPSGTTASLTSITTSLDPAHAVTSTCNAPTTPAGQPNTRTCTVKLTSTSAGTFTLNAKAIWTFSGLTGSVTRDTDPLTADLAGPGGSGPAVKHFVDANVLITPQEKTNKVGDEHVFTITTNAFPSGTTATFVSITPLLSPAHATTSTCGTPTTPVGEPNKRTCTVTLTSDSAGTFELNATAVWSFSGLAANVTRSTSGNSGPGGSDSAFKHFVDAYITIGEDGTNTVGDPHTFTVHVFQNDGRAAADPAGDGFDGFKAAPNGTLVDVHLTDSDGAANNISENTCDNVPPPGGTVAGACSVTFTSASAGTVTGHATVVFSIDGVQVTRQTDGQGQNSDDAVKVFVAGSIRWTKQYANALQAGATFEVCRTNDFTLPFGPIGPALANPVCFSTTDNDAKDKDTDGGEFLVNGLALGRYTVRETAAPPGFELDPDTETVDLTPGPVDSNKTITFPFVNSRPVLKITGFGYENVPDGAQPFGITKGITTYKVKIHNYGTALATLAAGSGLVVSDNAVCTPGNTRNLAGQTIAAGADSTEYTLTCSYDAPNAGPAIVIAATLTVKYTTNTVTRDASGSPATITFTVGPED